MNRCTRVKKLLAFSLTRVYNHHMNTAPTAPPARFSYRPLEDDFEDTLEVLVGGEVVGEIYPAMSADYTKVWRCGHDDFRTKREAAQRALWRFTQRQARGTAEGV